MVRRRRGVGGGGAGLALALLLRPGLVNYVDRVTLSVAGPLIAAELHLRPGQMGAAALGLPVDLRPGAAPVGALIDRLGPRRLLGGALTLWSAAQAATGLAAGLPQLIAARLALGVGEAPQWPTGGQGGAHLVRAAAAAAWRPASSTPPRPWARPSRRRWSPR